MASSDARRGSRGPREPRQRTLLALSHWRARVAGLAALVCATAVGWPGAVRAHDSSVSNGVFRSRDAGDTWLPLNPESFARGALALAVHPSDPHQLLLATDSGLLASRNGGRDWEPVASDVLVGPVFAVAFDANGQDALAAGTRALVRRDGTRWREARTPAGAAPARLLVAGGVPGRAYLAGTTGLHRTDDAGRSWSRAGRAFDAVAVSALVVSAARSDELHALAAGRLWASGDGARSWRVDDGAPPAIEALALDRTEPGRVWVVSAGRAWHREPGSTRWAASGAVLPDAQAHARGIDVLGGAMLVTTERGVFRSRDGGASWTPLSAELPNHAEATLLVHDPHDAATVYTGFSRFGREQLAPDVAVPALAMTEPDVALLVGVYAGFGVLLLLMGAIARRMTRDSRAPTTAHPLPVRGPSR